MLKILCTIFSEIGQIAKLSTRKQKCPRYVKSEIFLATCTCICTCTSILTHSTVCEYTDLHTYSLLVAYGRLERWFLKADQQNWTVEYREVSVLHETSDSAWRE